MKKLFSWILKFAVPSASGLFFSWSVFAVICAAGSNGDIPKSNTEMEKSRSNIYIADLTVCENTPERNSSEENSQMGNKASPESNDNALWQEIKKGFSYTFRTLGYGTINEPSDSTQNPNNDFLNIPRYTLSLDLRPDLSFNFKRLTLVVKPRLDLSWVRWETGAQEGDTNTNSDWYINEWLAGLNLVDGLFVSYGRENLQWGPSRLVSPSNPFFPFNGQRNPKTEVPGMDFARVVWVANSSWTASLLANLGSGRMDFPYGFEKTYAAKLDYTGDQKYGTLIGSYQENNRGQFGAYGGWWVSDALFLYTEGSISKGTNALYPQNDPTVPFGILMSPTKDDNSSPEGLLTVGGSYTLESGGTFTLEYFFNSPGYDDEEADLYLNLRGSAASTFYSPEPLHSLSEKTLMQTLDPRLRFLRRNYLTFQYYQIQIQDVLNLMLRYTYNVDDSSSMVVPIVEYDIGDYFQVFLVGNHRFGSKNSEFRSLIDYSYMLGVEFTF